MKVRKEQKEFLNVHVETPDDVRTFMFTGNSTEKERMFDFDCMIVALQSPVPAQLN